MDSLPLFNLPYSGDGEQNVITGVWQQVCELVKMLSNFKFCFVNQEGNGAAQVCASLVSESSLEVVWVSDVLGCHQCKL
jgi:hypothetical protein